jgi:polyhydroxyalkanoate synthase
MAHLGQQKDKRVKSATFFTAQLDFEDAGELQVFVDEHTVELVDSQMDKGYLPAQTMAKAFNLLRSNDLIWSYVVNNYMLGKEPFPFDLLYWNSDSTAMPAQVHHHYLESCYLKNAFAKGAFEVKGEPVLLSDIRGPVYHIATVEDHIAPATSVYRGARQMTGADVTFVLSGSGHIAGVVNPPALEKYQYWINSDLKAEGLEAWKKSADMTPGSWWPHWDGWLANQSKRQVKSRVPGAKLGVIEDAPGSYVKVRFDQ